jgi:predicted ATPase/DNA-binding CsgD family transcriptional regulator
MASEALYPVPPLTAPDPGQVDVAKNAAVMLFVARAQTAVAGFVLTDENQDTVADLCRRLDGLPLAIELAAAQVRVLTPQQILDRSADRFAMVSRGSRGVPLRQETLRACVDWSFGLTSRREQRLWARLSVFVGGFDLDAIEGVCADDALPVTDLLALVAGLVDKSIMDRTDLDDHGDQTRYRMLETIVDYGGERLAEAGERDLLQRQHRDWYRQLIAQVNVEWVSHRRRYWFVRLTRERANLRAAIEYCLTAPGEAQAALCIIVDLPRLCWFWPGAAIEGMAWLSRALSQAPARTVLRARALVLAAYLGVWHADAEAVLPLLEEGETLAEQLDYPGGQAFAAHVRAHAALLGKDIAGSIQHAQRAIRILHGGSEPELALHLHVLLQLGFAAGAAGDHEQAEHCYRQTLAITEPRGEDIIRTYALWGLGLLSWRRGEIQPADDRVRESLRLARIAGTQDRFFAAAAIDTLACIAAHRRLHEPAATLFGATDAIIGELDRPPITVLITDHDYYLRQTSDALGDAAFIAAFRRGQALPLDAAVAYALDERQRTPAATPSTSGAPMPLTRRESQVADLIAQGLSNKEIAVALFISQRTAESHVEHILAKLDFHSRVQVAAWVTDQRLRCTRGNSVEG